MRWPPPFLTEVGRAAFSQPRERRRYDVVARKNAPRDNCMYVNDGVISLRLLSKRKKCMCERERKSGRMRVSACNLVRHSCT